MEGAATESSGEASAYSSLAAWVGSRSEQRATTTASRARPPREVVDAAVRRIVEDRPPLVGTPSMHAIAMDLAERERMDAVRQPAVFDRALADSIVLRLS